MGRHTPYEFADLATYNSERARGIVHTPEWDALMAAEQRRFNETQYPDVDWDNVQPGDIVVRYGTRLRSGG